jgi:hypothetical protein
MTNETSKQSKPPKVGEVRYSLRTIISEVQDERKESVLGRELIDTNEIGKMFTERKRKKK